MTNKMDRHRGSMPGLRIRVEMTRIRPTSKTPNPVTTLKITRGSKSDPKKLNLELENLVQANDNNILVFF